MWLILQPDKGISSIRLAEMLGVSQPTAWRVGHAIRLMLAREARLGGIVETDEFYIGGAPGKDRDSPKPGRGRKGQPRTSKHLALSVVERPHEMSPGAPAGGARAQLIVGRTASAIGGVLADNLDHTSHLMSDEWGVFSAIGHNFAAHDAVGHNGREFVRGIVHVNSAEGLSDRVRRTVVGVFHHVSPEHANLYLHEIGFRWGQRAVAGQAIRQTRKGRTRVQTLWDRIPTALQLPAALRSIIGRQMRRTRQGGIVVQSATAVFGRQRRR
jgi:hypothetical protein